MARARFPAATLLLLALTFCLLLPVQGYPAPATGEHLSLAGVVQNPQGQGVKEVAVTVLVNGQPVKPANGEEIITDKSGSFLADFLLPAVTLPRADITVRAAKPSWRTPPDSTVTVLPAGTAKDGLPLFQAQVEISLKRAITPAFWIAAAVLLLVYVLIAAEVMHRTLAALLGAVVLLFISYTAGTFNKDYFILSYEDAIHAIDMNVIFLLMGMMIIVGVLKKNRRNTSVN